MAQSDAARVQRQLAELSLLYEISQILDQSLDLRDVVGPVLEAMASHMGMLHGTLALLNRRTGRIEIAAAHGLSRSEQDRGQYLPGEGLTGRVVSEGRPVAVPRISQEPLFLDKTGARKKKLKREEISFICVPIKEGNEVVGALSADRLFSEEVALDEDTRLLTIIASMIAQAVRLRRSIVEEREKLLAENERLQNELAEQFRPDNIIGSSQAMLAVYDAIAQVSKSTTTVLIRGESGVGKELVAHAIHHNSPRAGKPYVKVNCAALPETVLEAELFGHAKGAFTGATTDRKGRFEMADGGTLFLDEIGDFTPATQVRLLRVLQEREFERVGETEPRKVDVRIVAATNRDLESLMAAETFRQDLYYRLNVFPIHIPPLRERKSDVLLLANHFAGKYAEQNFKEIKRISTPAIDMLTAYHWPGNVRELENCIERAVLLSTDGVIHGHHLPPTLQTGEGSGTRIDGTLEQMLENYEREIIVEALKDSRGNRAKAARALGVSERIMGLRVEKYSIDAKRFRVKR
jgi:Nif-specific regulatory protein